MELEELKQYIDDSAEDLRDLATCTDAAEKRELVMAIYANFFDLRKECTSVLTILRKQYSITEAEVRAWMKEQDEKEDTHPVSESEDEPEEKGDQIHVDLPVLDVSALTISEPKTKVKQPKQLVAPKQKKNLFKKPVAS